MRLKNKKVCGVGVNDSDEPVYRYSSNSGIKVLVWTCPYYSQWHNILKRCYGASGRINNRVYNDCHVCEEWLLFSNFKKWMEFQDWQGMQLDKDLLIRGNKVYSPENCVFVKQEVNKFITERNESRGDYPIGVTFKESVGKFISQINEKGVRKHLGCFSTPEEAHHAWLKAKLEIAKEMAADILDEGGDPRVAKAIVERYENYKESP